MGYPTDAEFEEARRTAGLRGGRTTERVPRTGEPKLPGKLIIDQACEEVRVGKKIIYLTPMEYALIKLLAEAKGSIVSREAILNKGWGYDVHAAYELNTRTVDQHVFRIRRKAGNDLIRTRVGGGFYIPKAYL